MQSSHVAGIERELGGESHAGAQPEGIEIVAGIQKLSHRWISRVLGGSNALGRLASHRLASRGSGRDGRGKGNRLRFAVVS